MTIVAPLARESARSFVLAGKARFTVKNTATGNRFTYRVSASKDGAVHFVAVLTGADNEGDYEYIGTIRGGVFSHGTKSRIGADALSVKAFAWSFPRLESLPSTVEIWHEGRCGRCGRCLTVPESVASGLGPECASKAA